MPSPTPHSLTSPQRTAKRIMLVVILLTFAAVFFLDPIPQDPAYHHFADDRLLWGIPNLWNVLTNLPFLVVGTIGLRYCLRTKPRFAASSWMVFFVGVALVSFGSAYYHLAPNNSTLFWDRLPMTVAFMSLLIAIIVEFVANLFLFWCNCSGCSCACSKASYLTYNNGVN